MSGTLTAAIAATATSRTTAIDMHVTLPCTPMSVPTVRQLVRLLAADCPRLDDLLLITSELVTCGIAHPASAGGAVTVSAVIGECTARIAMAHDLAPVRERATNTGFGRAMVLVHDVADVCYHLTVGDRAETTAEVKW